MGIWSEPLGASPVYVVNVDDIKAAMKPECWDELVSNDMFKDLQGEQTWETCIMATSRYANIWGYLNTPHCAAWNNLYAVLHQLYPDQTEPWMAHFWCSDHAHPYSITCEGETVYLYSGESNNAAYTTFDKSVDIEKDNPYIFSLANYLEILNSGKLEYICAIRKQEFTRPPPGPLDFLFHPRV